jgi:hypothetical protein
MDSSEQQTGANMADELRELKETVELQGGQIDKLLQRIRALEEQAEVNRQTINAMIGRDDAIIGQFAAALGQMKPGTVAKIKKVGNVIKGDE